MILKKIYIYFFTLFTKMKIKGCEVNVCQIASGKTCSRFACMVLVMPDKYHTTSSTWTRRFKLPAFLITALLQIAEHKKSNTIRHTKNREILVYLTHGHTKKKESPQQLICYAFSVNVHKTSLIILTLQAHLKYWWGVSFDFICKILLALTTTWTADVKKKERA